MYRSVVMTPLTALDCSSDEHFFGLWQMTPKTSILWYLILKLESTYNIYFFVGMGKNVWAIKITSLKNITAFFQCLGQSFLLRRENWCG